MACSRGKRSCAVCAEKIEDKIAKYVTDYEGQKYYFCSTECQREFNEGVDKYVGY